MKLLRRGSNYLRNVEFGSRPIARMKNKIIANIIGP